MNVLLDAALAYARHGIPVFPCGPDKRPLTEHGFKNASTSEKVICAWWAQWPAAMIALPTGTDSKINVADLDNKNGRNGHEAIPDWATRSPVISRTMSGGHHIFYQHRDGNRCSSDKIARGVDIRAEGGYVIVPPSPGYEWVGGFGLPAALPHFPDDLMPKQRTRGNGHAAPEAKTGLEEGVESESEPEAGANEIARALAVIPSEDFQVWFEIACALHETLGDAGFPLFDDWSRKSNKYASGACLKKWEDIKEIHTFGMGTILHYAKQFDPKWKPSFVERFDKTAKINDFIAYLPMYTYLFIPTCEMWPAMSVNACIPMQGKTKASTWLDTNVAVEQMTWAPGEPLLIRDKLITNGGWFERKGSIVFNQYRPPTIKPREGDVTLWRRHLIKLYGEESAVHVENWMAHRVQRPAEKVNHALILGGEQGIGKDTLLEPLKQAVGPWNFEEENPKRVLSSFSGYLKAVVLRISEARDLGEFDRYGFYDHLKVVTAVPPDTLKVNEKHIREYMIPNLVGVIITTNYKTNGIYLPADDRRNYVAWSSLERTAFPDEYWNEIWRWYGSGGFEYVAHHLATHDLSGFDAKAPPIKTAAFWEIVGSSPVPENAELADALEVLAWPKAVTLHMVAEKASYEFQQWLTDRKNFRIIPHRFEECDYVPVRQNGPKDGLWIINGRRVAVYAKRNLSANEAYTAVKELVAGAAAQRGEGHAV